MNKSDLIKKLAQTSGITEKEARFVTEKTLESITDALKTGDRVEIRGFGVFSTKIRDARQARNPRTGETVSVPRTSIVHFKVGKKLREELS